MLLAQMWDTMEWLLEVITEERLVVQSKTTIEAMIATRPAKERGELLKQLELALSEEECGGLVGEGYAESEGILEDEHEYSRDLEDLLRQSN